MSINYNNNGITNVLFFFLLAFKDMSENKRLKQSEETLLWLGAARMFLDLMEVWEPLC